MTTALIAKQEKPCSEGTCIWRANEITGRNADNFLRWVTDKLKDGMTTLIIDLSLVEYINAGGLSSMLRAGKLASFKGIHIAWRNADENIANLVRLAGLDDILELA